MKPHRGYEWVVALVLLLAPTAAWADSAEIEQRCSVRYPGVTQRLAWKDCVKAETHHEADDELRRQAEDQNRLKKEAARPCLAGDIARMEEVARQVKEAVRSEASLEEVKETLVPIIEAQGKIQIASDNNKERVLVTSIPTRCDLSFHFLINVREGADKKLRWLRVWAVDAPAGYPDDLHSDLSLDFDTQRQQKLQRAEDAKRQDDARTRIAKLEQEREEQRQRFLQGVKIVNARIKCAKGDSCSSGTIEFVVTNISPQPVRDISFGWMILPPQMKECPIKLATNEEGPRSVLQPGEKISKTISFVGAPETRDAKYCLRVTDFRAVNPWER